MSLPEIKYCPSSLQTGHTSYSPGALQALFGSRSRKVSHILPFAAPGKNNEQTREYNEKRKTISISGVQEKYYLRLEKNQLRLTASGGTHILKPIPAERLERVRDLPANEHVSMQLARQIFGIKTADCGLVFFEDGEPAYITRRFDHKPDGSGKYKVEDFATLLARSPEKEGSDYKYNGSYSDIARQIQQYASAPKAVLLEFFKLLVFNYLIANGDAHLKNFSLIETTEGDFILSPAYDLLCTALHIDDSRLALHNGLYDKDYEEPAFSRFGVYTGASFVCFAEKAGIPGALAESVVAKAIQAVPEAVNMIGRSFLSVESQSRYIEIMEERAKCLRLN